VGDSPFEVEQASSLHPRPADAEGGVVVGIEAEAEFGDAIGVMAADFGEGVGGLLR
jgi:hypothetical protein